LAAAEGKDIAVTILRHKGKVTKTENDGRKISLVHKGKVVSARIPVRGPRSRSAARRRGARPSRRG
jgi:hypothetical protein